MTSGSLGESSGEDMFGNILLMLPNAQKPSGPLCSKEFSVQQFPDPASVENLSSQFDL